MVLSYVIEKGLSTKIIAVDYASVLLVGRPVSQDLWYLGNIWYVGSYAIYDYKNTILSDLDE